MMKYFFSIALVFTVLGSLQAQNTFHQDNENLLYRFGLELMDKENVPSGVLKYINRLSDLFFVMARYVSVNCGNEEIIWKPEK